MKNKKFTPTLACIGLSYAVFTFLVFAIAFVKTSQRADADESNPVTKTLLAGVEARENSVRSASGYFVKEFYSNKDASLDAALEEIKADAIVKHPNYVSHLFWAVEENKAREDEKVTSSKRLNYQLAADNGEKIQTWGFGDPTATELGQDRKEDIGVGQQISYALQIATAQGSLSRQFKAATPQFKGKELVAGVETYKISSILPEDTLETWWVAPQLNSLVMKHEVRSTPKPTQQQIVAWRTVDIVDETLKVGEGLWVPKTIRIVSYVTINPEKPVEVWKTLYRFSVLALNVNKPIPAETFELPLPLGTRVGGKGRESYYVGGDISSFEERVQKEQPDAKALLDLPIEAAGEKTP